MDIQYIKNNIHEGMTFEKVKCSSKVLKVMDDGFTYAIGKNGNKKKVTFIEVQSAISKIETDGYIDRKWHQTAFPAIAKACPCNFTSIGGILRKFEFVNYSNRRYVKN